jgi:hypothetical protein
MKAVSFNIAAAASGEGGGQASSNEPVREGDF